MQIYDFTHLENNKQRKYDDFKRSLCAKDSPLSKTTNEENLRYVFENELNKLLRDLEFIDNEYEFFEHESKNASGRTDFQYGNTIIEYKKYGLLAKSKDISEFQSKLQNYLKDTRFSGFKIYGFLFDGQILHSYTKNENDEILNNGGGELNALNIDAMIKTLFSSGIVAISPNNLKKDFAIIDKFDNVLAHSEALNLAKYLLKLLNKTQIDTRTQLLFSEWEKLFRLAENDNGQHEDIAKRREVFSQIFGVEIDKNNEYKALFALHTTLSIIIKLLLTQIIDNLPQIQTKIHIEKFYKENNIANLKQFFTSIENGSLFKKVGVINLTDNDFFAWYVKEDFNNELKEILQKIIFKICAYENICIAKNSAMLDMFKELYLGFIPKCVRHSFGEYYTPYWLAERTLLSATSGDLNLHDKTFIDPSCGSGTFLSVFFNYKHKNLKQKIDFAEFVRGIVGVDINPIAVLMARANIFIQATKKCHFDITKKYEIPVYLADSLYVPNAISIGGEECLDYELYTTGLQKEFHTDKVRIVLPKKLIENDEFLNIIALVEKHIVNLDKKSAITEFQKHCESLTNNDDLRKQIQKNVDELIKFEAKKLNSIWLKIFSNYFRVATFDKFDYIVGNPAWVQWSVLPEAYRENIKANMRLEGLFSSDTNVGGNNLNICALIANKCCERWLSDNGKFAFLMPKSILFNKSFEGFRNLIINGGERLYFNEVLDFSNGGEIFEGVGLNFCSFKISKTPNAESSIVPLIDYSKKKQCAITHNDKWSEAKEFFRSENKFAVQLQTEFNNNFLLAANLQKANHLKSLVGKCEYQFRKGVSVEYPMRLQFVKIASHKGRGIFHPYIKVGSRLKPDENRQIELELTFIKPFVTAPMLKESAVEWENSYCICPYAPNTKQPLPKDELKKLAPYIYRYLDDIDENLGKGSKFNKRVQNFSENYGILRMGSYVWAKHFVCIRDNTNLAPTYIGEIKTHWGHLTSPLFDNHISFVSQVKDGKVERFIDKKEALYLLLKLQDKDAIEIIMSSQDSRSISSRLPINVPIYRNDKNAQI